MTTDIWQVGQKLSAEELYSKPYLNIDNNFVIGGSGGLLIACKQMTETYEQIIDDQNDYVIEIEAGSQELQLLEKHLQDVVERLKAEIEELNKKKENGTITEDEEALLASKVNELNALTKKSDKEIEDKIVKVQGLVVTIQNNEHKTKTAIATDYGETTIEKGESLTQVQDKKKTFWRRLFKTWDKSGTRGFGEKMIDAGEELLDKVNTAEDANKKIATFKITNSSK